MHNRLLITGASGTGTTTLGRALAKRIDAAFFDADHYHFVPSEPPYQRKEDPANRLRRILSDLEQVQSAVIAGSIMDWGDRLEDTLTQVVFLTVPAPIRLNRLYDREMQRFGSVDPEFIAWAEQYEEGQLPGRSLSRHRVWLAKRSCPILHLDGDLPTEDRVVRVMQMLEENP